MGKAARRLAVIRRKLYDTALQADEWLAQNARPSRSIAIFVRSASAGAGLTVALIGMAHTLLRRGYLVALVQLVPSEGPPVRPISTNVGLITVPEHESMCCAMRSVLAELQPDYIYVAGIDGLVLRSIRQAAPSKAKLIFGDHDARRACQAAADGLPPGYLFALSEFDAIHAVNEEVSDVARNVTRKPVFTIANPGPPPIRRQRSIFRSRRVVVVSRLAEGKHIQDVICAFDSLAPRFPKWTLEIYGRGPQRGLLAELIRSKPTRRKIKLMRFTRDVSAILSDSAMMVSASEAEAFSCAYLEAMSSSCPIVSYDGHMGARAILRHDDNAFLAKHLDRDALAEEMSRVMEMIENRDPLIGRVLKKGRATIDVLREERIARQWDVALRALARPNRY